MIPAFQRGSTVGLNTCVVIIITSLFESGLKLFTIIHYFHLVAIVNDVCNHVIHAFTIL